jgi:hypothetical protein
MTLLSFLKSVQARIEALPYPLGHILTFLWVLIFVFAVGSILALALSLPTVLGALLLSLF